MSFESLAAVQSSGNMNHLMTPSQNLYSALYQQPQMSRSNGDVNTAVRPPKGQCVLQTATTESR
eukprot:14803148-Ditylum_brightwellii.AAC.1